MVARGGIPVEGGERESGFDNEGIPVGPRGQKELLFDSKRIPVGLRGG